MYLCRFKKVFLEQANMLETILKGILIGVLVSAPVGPMGMFTIQRTLSRGRWHGFFTGLGITSSDLIYAFIAMVGVGAFSSFLANEKIILQFIGSIVLIILGFLVFRSNPLKGWTPKMQVEQTKYHLEYISAFLLAIMNIGVLVLFITLFAHFQFNPIAEGKGRVLVAMLSVFSGAVMWWLFMTGVVSRLRKHFNRQGLILLNRVIGSLLMAIGTVGLLWLLF